MKKQISILSLLLLLLLAACSAKTQPSQQESRQDTDVIVKVFKPPS